MGLGLEYALVANSSLYANISQGYKPPQFDDLAPTGNNTLPATSLDPGKTWTFELGAKGHPINGWTFDLSLFRTIYDNFFGTVTVGSFTQRQNVGKAIYQGADLLAELDLIRLVFPQETALGNLSLYGNVSLLDAEFDEGPLAGREPAYAPAYLAKAGLVYRKSDWVKLALMGTWVEDHYWADNNQAAGVGLTAIPSYGVWDLMAEFRPLRHLKVVAGINNLTDEIYFSRVRSDGIEPALRRNYYAGLTLEW
jgi:Fe(3+) dicitrate transport protein